MPIIEVSHVTKEFQLGQLISLRQSLRNGWAHLAGGKVTRRQPFKALDDVSFSVEPGEVVGIIGHNGAGKSTLLKILAGVSRPTTGNVVVRGRVAPLIEVGAGLVPDLTGRENIYLNGTILGMRRDEIKRKFDEIVAFAELEEFIDTPLKRYSSGMHVRLGFSIATCVESEILIVDEVLSVGDLAFQRKSFDRMENLIRKEQRTVLLVSHNIRQVERVCTRAILLDHGRPLMDGAPKQVGNAFYEISDRAIRKQRQTSALKAGPADWPDVEFLGVDFVRPQQSPGDPFVIYDEPAEVVLRFRAKREIRDPTFGLGIHTTDLLYLSATDTDMLFRPGLVPTGEFAVRWQLEKLLLLPGVYALHASVAAGEALVFFAENVVQFRVTSSRLSRARAREQGFIELRATGQLVTHSGPLTHLDSIQTQETAPG